MIYDVKTKNRTFLKVASQLRKMGIRNNKFMLELYDKSLQGVNPYDKELTIQQKLAIFKECSINKWYYLREVVRVPVEGKIEGSMYKLHFGNLSISYLKLKNQNIYVILPRQHYKTTSVIIDDTWNLLFASTNTNIIYAHKEFKDSKKNLKAWKDIKGLLPNWLTAFVANSKNDKDNEEYKLVFNRNNTLKAVSSANTDEQADKLGRGMTTALIYFDEFAFLSRNDIIYAAAYPAFSRASENAKKNGVPYGITITTTPNSVEPRHGEFAKEFMDNAALWRLELLDLDDKQLEEYLDKNSVNDFLKVEFTYKELGRDEVWLKKQIRGFNNDMMKIKREILLDWPRSNESSVFNEAQLDRIFAYVKPSVFTLFVKNYPIAFYEKPDFNMNYIISVDVAGGQERDNTAILLIAPDDFRVVADFKNSKIDTEDTKQLLEELMIMYFRSAILIIERNSYGLNLVQYFRKQPLIERRMLKESTAPKGQKTVKDGFNVRRASETFRYGVDTNVKTRKQMFDLLPDIVDNHFDKLITSNLYDDIAALQRKETGKIEHANGAHDDSLMAYLIFRWALNFGNCLRDKFGISPMETTNNIKNASAAVSLSRMDKILENLRHSDDIQESFFNNPMYTEISDQERKINEQFGGEERTDQMDAFLRIIDLNN